VVIALIVSGALAARAFGAGSTGYRTAVVGRHPVDALLNGVATIEPVNQAAVAFPAAGTVASVNVQVGDTVSVGQTLASLDPKVLLQTLHERQATLDQAELVLTRALAGEDVSGPNGSGPAGSGSVAAASTDSERDDDDDIVLTAAAIPSAGPSVADAQQAVLAAQRNVDAALNTATQALDSATTVCAATGIGSTASAMEPEATLTACQSAIRDVLRAQTVANTAQQTLAEASRDLDALLAQQAAAPSTGTSEGTTDRDVSTGQPSASAAASPSAADLVAHQKAVDAAEAEVAVAVQAIAQATIVSPIAGTVAESGLAVGDSVDAGSTTATVVVVGTGGYEATTTVSVDDVSDVEVGQRATLLPDGSKRALDGTVTSIALVPDDGAATTSYRVTIGLADPDADLDNGSTGSVTIVTESSRTGLAVPTSAVSTTGTRHAVTVLDRHTTERVAVEVGVVGVTWTEITSGVAAGQVVVLADLDEPLPGSATESSGTDQSDRGPGVFPGGLRGAFPGGVPPGR
jgi:HlyD family secretion protein